MNVSKFLVVSNRLPVNIVKTDGKLEFHSSSGGLATAMSSLKGADDKIWVGWPGIANEDLTDDDRTQITTELQKYGCYPVFLSREDIALFYEGYSNDTLWPLFHYFQAHTVHRGDYWESYRHVNQTYLDAIKQVADPEAKIWIQDYHLMLLPQLTREAFPDASIGFFLHIPFPSYEIFRLLPERVEILQGLLGCDLIGFHIYDYARHFLSSCLRILGITSSHGVIHHDGRKIKVDSYPIGIDYQKFRDTLRTDSVKTAIATLKDSYPNQKIILSVDRLDYSKGIPERLEAYRLLLKENPEYIRKVKLVMVAVPSRTEVETYKNLRDIIEQTVSRINGEFGTVDWAPISYQFQNLPFDKIVALYNVSDVALVTPVRDGMNLVAKEYIASKTSRSPGVLVLSEMTGASDELPEALVINPNDFRSVEAAIKQGLTMSLAERKRRQLAMQERIADYTVQRWGEDFMTDLADATDARSELHRRLITESHRRDIAAEFREAGHRLLLLDYDGTLQTFKSSPKPSAAKPSERVRQIIKRLTNLPRTHVAIISGRPKSVLDKWFRDVPITLIAEHGGWARHDGEWSQIDTAFSIHKKSALPILEHYTSRTAGSLIEKKDFALVWHYRNVAPELAYVRASNLKRELRHELADTDIGVYSGNKIVEVKPRSIHKGYSAMELMAMFPSDFVLCAGDDYTDEDMFKELSGDAVTIKIGNGDTSARFQITKVSDFVSLLDELSRETPD